MGFASSEALTTRIYAVLVGARLKVALRLRLKGWLLYITQKATDFNTITQTRIRVINLYYNYL